MKRGAIDHPKTHMLCDLLELQRWEAVGILESIWHWTCQYAQQGDIGRWPNRVIARGIGWLGDADKLIDALVESGWLDRVDDPQVRLAIHDLADHADNSWRECLSDRGLTFWDGTPARRSTCGRPRKSGSRNTPEKLQNNSHETPQPEPEPEPEPEPGGESPTDSLSAEADPAPVDSSPTAADDAGAPDASPRLDLEATLVARWNACEGVVRNSGDHLTDARRRAFRARLRDPAWFDRALAAMQKFPLLCTRGHPDGWRPDMDWFLKPDSVTRILEGKYDWSKEGGKHVAGGAFDGRRPAKSGRATF